MSLKALAIAIMTTTSTPEQVVLENAVSVGDVGIGGPDASIGVSVNSNKTVTALATNFGTVYSSIWLIPDDADAGDYEVEFHNNGGSSLLGTLDSWLALSGNHGVSLEQTVSGGTAATELRIRIRRASDSVVVKSVVWYLTASKET